MQKIFYILGGLIGLLLLVMVGGVVYLNTLDFNSFKPQIISEVKKITGRDLTLEGDIDLEIGLNPSLAIQGVALSNFDGSEHSNMVELREAEAQVALMPLISGIVNVKKIVLKDVLVILERNADGSANWELAGADRNVPEKDTTESSETPQGQGVSLPVIDSLLLENVRVLYSDAVSGQNQDVTIKSLSGIRKGSETNLELRADVNGEDVVLSAVLADLESLLSEDTTQVSAELKAAGATLTAQGEVGAEAVNLALSAKGNNISDFSRLAATAIPDSPDYDVSAQLMYGNGQLDVSDLLARLGSSDLSGRINIELSNVARPVLRAELTSNKLDVNELSGGEASQDVSEDSPAQAVDAQADTEGEQRLIPDTPLQLSGLRGMDMDISLNVGEVSSGTLIVSDLGLRILNNNGLFTLKPASASFEGGQIELTTTLDGRKDTGVLQTDLLASDLDLSGLLSAFGADGNLLQGTLGGKVDLSSSGQTVRDVAGNLNGEISFISTEGKVGQGYLNLLAGDLLSQLPLLTTVEQETKLNCVIASFDVKDGLATTRTVVMDTERMTVRVEGDINLKTEELDLKITPSSKDAGISLATAIRVGGTFASPSFGPDAGDIAGKALGLAAGIATGGVAGLLLPLATAGNGAEEACGDALSSDSGEPQKPTRTENHSPPNPADVLEQGIKSLFGR